MRFFLLFFLMLITIETVNAQESKNIIIRNVDIIGMSFSNKYIIQNNLNLKSGGVFNPNQVSNGIKFLYNSQLFKDIQVYIRPVNTVGDTIDVKVVVYENPKVNSVDFVGNTKFSSKKLKDTILVKEDKYLTEYDLMKSNQIIKNLYNNKGYYFINITNILNFTKDTNHVDVIFKIIEGKKVIVEKIDFEGNSYFDDDKLRSLMETKQNSFWRFWGIDFKEDTLKNDLKKIEHFYKENGFLDAKVINYKVDFDQDRKAYITIQVNEGKRYYVGDIKFVGNKLYDTLTLLKNIDLKKNSVFKISKEKKSLMKLSNLYSEKGYLYVHITPQKEFKDSLVNIIYNIEEGTPAYVHKVIIKNNTKTKDYVIRREIAIKPGEIYQQSKVFLSYQRLAQLNFFKNIIPDVVPYDSNSVDIVFTVDEGFNGQISAGMQYSEYGFAGTLNLSLPNFLGSGQYIGGNVEYGQNRKYFSFSFTEPWFMNLKDKTSLGMNLYYENVYYDDGYGISYKRKRIGGALSSSRRLRWPDNMSEVSATYSLETQDYTDLSDLAKEYKYYVEGRTLQSKLSLGFYRNNTDWPQFPNKGSFIGYYPEISGKFLGGDKHFFKQSFVTNLYIPTFWKFVLSVKTKIAVLSVLSGNTDKSNIYTEYFWLGGYSYDGILRGYPDNAFGPGQAMILSRINYRFPIVDKMIYLAAFMDFGNVYKHIENVNLLNLNKAIGAGVRVLVPGLGLIGVDFGWGLDKYDSNRNGVIDIFDKRGGYNYTIQINQTF